MGVLKVLFRVLLLELLLTVLAKAFRELFAPVSQAVKNALPNPLRKADAGLDSYLKEKRRAQKQVRRKAQKQERRAREKERKEREVVKAAVRKARRNVFGGAASRTAPVVKTEPAAGDRVIQGAPIERPKDVTRL